MREAQEAFAALVEACMTDRDALYIRSDGSMSAVPVQGAQRYLKNSMWLKVALGFNLDMETIDSMYNQGEDKNGKFFFFLTKVRVTAPNGRFVIGVGSCSSRDPFFSKAKGYEKLVQPQDVQMKSETVAYNRAISAIVGRREVSAEEIEGKEPVDSQPAPKQKTRFVRRSAPADAPADAPAAAKGKDRPDSEPSTSKDRSFICRWLNTSLDLGMPLEECTDMLGKVTDKTTIGDLRKIERILLEKYIEARPKSGAP